MNPEERIFFSQNSRFQNSGPVIEQYFANDMEEDSRNSPIAFPSGANCWEATRGAKLHGCAFDQNEFAGDLEGLQLTEGLFSFEANLGLPEERERERLRLHNKINYYIADLEGLLDVYEQLRELVSQEGQLNWHWKVGLWEQTKLWKQIKPMRDFACRNRSKYDSFQNFFQD